MKLVNNIKIRTKLIILIIIMVLGTTSIGVVGYLYNDKANSALKNLYNRNLMEIEKISDVRSQLQDDYTDILHLFIVAETEQKAVLDDIKTRTENINRDFEAYEKTKISKAEAQQLETVKAEIAGWSELSQRIAGFAETGKISDAKDLFESEGKAAFEALEATVSDLEDKSVAEAETIYSDNKDDSAKAGHQIILLIVCVTVVGLLLGNIIMITTARSVRSVVSLIKKTSNLDLVYDSTYRPLLTQKDDVGIIAREVAALREILRKMTTNVLNVSHNLAASSEELAAGTEQNTKTIHQVVNAVNEIAEGNSVQAEMVEKISETITAMTSNIDRVNRATAVNKDNAGKSLEIIEEGQKAIDLTMEKMKANIKVAGDVGESINELSNQMDKVGNIITVIKGISEQTNLLALNASIEAARAGEAGKGFAVVASEIGKLAQNTASAVDEITGIIDAAISRNAATSRNNELAMGIVLEQEKAVNITMEAFENIKKAVEDIAKRTMKVSDSIGDIYNSSNSISKQALDMSAVAQEAAASSEEISASNEEQLASVELIASAANELSVMASDLNGEISKFNI